MPEEIRYRIDPLSDRHRRSEFSCGVEALDLYLRRQAGQDLAKHVAAVFVLTPDAETIAGFYTLSAHSIQLSELPVDVARKLPRYPNVPATLLGRLAVSLDFRGKGIGELLLVDALKRAAAGAREIASVAVLVDAKDDRAHRFYLNHGFIPLSSTPNRLFYPIKSIAKPFASKSSRSN